MASTKVVKHVFFDVAQLSPGQDYFGAGLWVVHRLTKEPIAACATQYEACELIKQLKIAAAENDAVLVLDSKPI